jgi:micrococcal nuclease
MSERSLLGLAALACATAAGCGGSPCGATEAVVGRVLDGDTVELENGVKIRYLLVNTPEVSGGGECYGSNATQFNTDLVLGKRIELFYDVECTDRFNRTLAYVKVGNIDVNAELIRRGYGCVLHIPPNGTDRVEEMRAHQTEAKDANRGLWGACDPLPPACR